MRHILLDRARRRVAAKRGGALPKVNLDQLPEIGSARARELIALDDALTALADIDSRKARVTATGHEASTPFFRRAVELDPQFAAAYAWLGRAYSAMGEMTLAAEASRRA